MRPVVEHGDESMTDRSSSPAETAALSLSRAEQWTLHHVLVDRLTGEGNPSTALVEAFSTLDAGGTAFTRPQLERLQAVVATYHHRTSWWEVERPQIEAVLDCVSTALEGRGGE